MIRPFHMPKRAGFTLIEAMIAVTILTLSVAGPLLTASRSIVSAEIARYQLTASYLAQEGIEYVRMMRDNEFLAAYQVGGATVSADAWNNFLNNPVTDTSAITQCRSPKKCVLDPVQGATSPMSQCPGNDCSTIPLYLTNCTNGPGGTVCTPPNVYTEQNLPGSIQTPFTRSIQAIDMPSGTDERIVSTVSWSYHGIPYSVTVSDHLTPWQ